MTEAKALQEDEEEYLIAAPPLGNGSERRR